MSGNHSRRESVTGAASCEFRRAFVRDSRYPQVQSEIPCTLGADSMNEDEIPDIRDGLTRKERTVLHVLHAIQQERGDANVPTALLWGRVCEYFYIRPDELTEMLARLGARR
jgi:hypothetical protein